MVALLIDFIIPLHDCWTKKECVTSIIIPPLNLVMVLLHLDYAIETTAYYCQKDIKRVERMKRLAMGCVEGCRIRYVSTDSNVLKHPNRHTTSATVNKLIHEGFVRSASCRSPPRAQSQNPSAAFSSHPMEMDFGFSLKRIVESTSCTRR